MRIGRRKKPDRGIRLCCSGESLPWEGQLADKARPAQEDRGGSVTRDDYRTGEKAAGISNLFCCRIGRTPAWGGH